MYSISVSVEKGSKRPVQVTRRCIRGPVLSIKHSSLNSRKVSIKTQIQALDDIVLVGDIGGTNARLSVWSTNKETAEATEIYEKTYLTSSSPTFEGVLTQFLNEKGLKGVTPRAASLAIAGAIEDNKCNMTNVNWIVDGQALRDRFDFQVALLNDFEAVGYGIPVLNEQDLICVNSCPVKEKGPKVVMGPGTGLGAAQLTWDEGLNHYRVLPGEGAHATFAPRGWKQRALAEFVNARFGHCEIEQVACGKGLELIYQFLLTDELANRPDTLKGRVGEPKRAEWITSSALRVSDPLSVEAVDLFLAIVGQEAGAMALRVLAKGGVYIAGGITPRLLPRVGAGALLEGFLMRRGRAPFHRLLASTPLFIITNGKVGQIGAREVAKRLII